MMRFLRVADGRRYTGIRHGDHRIGLDRRLARELAAEILPDVINTTPAQYGIGAGEVDIFEDAGPGAVFREGTVAFDAVLGDDHHLAVLDLAHELGADNVERAGLRRQHVGAVELAQH